VINIYIFNVGHGDSAIIEYVGGDGRAYGVIDSNRHNVTVPPALVKLKELNVEQLSFICLTHPHRDHYNGLYDILSEFRGRIHQLYTFPIGDLLKNRKRLKALAKKYQTIRDSQDDVQVRRGVQEFLQIIRFATENFLPDNWIECAGEDTRIAPLGFHDVTIKTILPPRKARGYYIQQIESGDTGTIENLKDNDLSIAFQVNYKGQSVILGGDGTRDNWLNHVRWQERARITLRTMTVKLPHHGSRIDCDALVLSRLFLDAGERAAIISANGHSHPDREVLEWLEANGISPFCTNLVPQCGANVAPLLHLPGLDPVLARWLREVSESAAYIQPCQGNITISIGDDGLISVRPEFAHPCGYRGDYRALLM
jgi:beta-lactamase superfamily II metal-dependent hydrolase